MNTSLNQNTSQAEIQMFGETIEEMVQAAKYRMGNSFDLISYAQGILSDAQYVASFGDHEKARQFINKAKFFMSEANTLLRAAEKE